MSREFVLAVYILHHIINVMFQMNTSFDNQINFLISGDLNKHPFTDIMLANEAIKQVFSVSTRKSKIL